MQYYRTIFTESWGKLKKLLPDVKTPLFHATGHSIVSILRSGRLLSSSSGAESNWGNSQLGISTSRNIEHLQTGKWGNNIVVLDRNEIQNKYTLGPFQYFGMDDEYEERIQTNIIPAKYIKAIVFTKRDVRKFEKENWASWKDEFNLGDVKLIYFDGSDYTELH